MEHVQSCSPPKGSFAAALRDCCPAPATADSALECFATLPLDLVANVISRIDDGSLAAAGTVCRHWRVAVAALAQQRIPAGLAWLHSQVQLRQLHLYLAVSSNFIRSPRAPGPITVWVRGAPKRGADAAARPGVKFAALTVALRRGRVPWVQQRPSLPPLAPRRHPTTHSRRKPKATRARPASRGLSSRRGARRRRLVRLRRRRSRRPLSRGCRCCSGASYGGCSRRRPRQRRGLGC